MIEHLKICEKCILLEGFLGTTINSERVCNYCENPHQKNINWSKTLITKDMREVALKDWNSVVDKMKENRGIKKYDCVLGYSGGKDSTALLDYLASELNLTPLAVTIDTGFMTDIAKDNIKDTLSKIKVDQVLIEESAKTFSKLYKWHFLNHTSNEISLTRYICDYCSDLIHSIVLKEALKRKIPYVLFGYSPDQVARYFYEMPQEEVILDWKPELLSQEPFNKEDEKWYLAEKEIRDGDLPRVLLPYHVIPYREEEIIELVESKQLIKKGHADPLLTNCNVVHAATFYDLNRFGGIPYALQYAELVRQDNSIRKKWLTTIKRSMPLILDNKFKEAAVNNFLETIGLTKEGLLKVVQKKLENDPNKNKIESLIETIRNKKFGRIKR